MEKDILEGNAKIDVFMGYEEIPKGHYTRMNPNLRYFGKEFFSKNYNRVLSEKELQYHSLWDWLMPVVEKIEKWGYKVSINTGDIQIDSTSGQIDDFSIYVDYPSPLSNPSVPSAKSKILCTWKAVVCFIDWYDTNHPNRITN